MNHCHKTNVFIHGGPGCGKTSLVQSLVDQAPRAAPYPRADIAITQWMPTQQLYNTLETDTDTSFESSSTIQLWELSGKMKLKGILPACIYHESLHMVLIDASVYDITDVIELWTIIQSNTPYSPIVFVVTKVDKIIGNSQSITETLADIIGCIGKHEDHRKRNMESLIFKYKTNGIQEQEIKRLKKLQLQGISVPTDAIFASCKTGKGLTELSAYILKTVFRIQIRHEDALGHGLLPNSLLDDILTTVRQDGDVFILRNDFKKLLEGISSADITESLIRELHQAGTIIDFGHRVCSDASKDIICINPETLARCLYAVHVTDCRRTVLVESNRFWPKTSGYKKPSPTLLSRVIGDIPNNGMIREILLPILLQDFDLSVEQVSLLADALQRLGYLTKGDNCRDNCEGLIMPGYQTSSVHAQYHVVHLDRLPDKPPRLHWTTRPFEGDMQLAWRFQFGPGTPAMLPRAVSACCQSALERRHTYMFQWKYGCLIRTTDCLVCLEHDICQLTIHIRRDVADLGCQQKTAQCLWFVLLAYIRQSLQLLQTWEGVVYEILLLPRGAGFVTASVSCDDAIIYPLDNYLSLHTHKALVLTATESEIDVDLLFPFTGILKCAVFHG